MSNITPKTGFELLVWLGLAATGGFCEELVFRVKVRPRKDHRGIDLISDLPPFSRLWYAGPDPVNDAIGYAKFCGRSHHDVIPVYDAAGKM